MSAAAASTSEKIADAQQRPARQSLGPISRPLIISRFCTAIGVFFLLNLVVGLFTESQKPVFDEAALEKSEWQARQQGPWAWWITRAYLMRAKPPEIAVFGSSQMNSATFCADANNLNKTIDCVLHRRNTTLEMQLAQKTQAHVQSVNLAMGGAMASDALMLSRALFSDDHKPKLVIASVSPRDFIDNDLPCPSATDPFKFLAPYVMLDDLNESAYPDWLSRADWFLSRYLPLKNDSGFVNAALDATLHSLLGKGLSNRASSQIGTTAGAREKQNTALLQAICGGGGDVKPGQWLVPARMPRMWQDNTREYLHRYRKPAPQIYTCERKFFQAFLADMHSKSIPVIVVEMPTLPMNSSLLPPGFWQGYQSWLHESCQKYDASLCDLSHSDQFSSEDYLDTVHLNARGGKRFFDILSDAVAKHPKWPTVISHARWASDSDPDDLGGSATVGTWK